MLFLSVVEARIRFCVMLATNLFSRIDINGGYGFRLLEYSVVSDYITV